MSIGVFLYLFVSEKGQSIMLYSDILGFHQESEKTLIFGKSLFWRGDHTEHIIFSYQIEVFGRYK